MQHGGDVYTEGILKGKELIDFSSNINPLGVPKGFIDNLNEGILNITRYPDLQYRQLRANLKEYINNVEILFGHGDRSLELVHEEDFILGNGAAEIIDLTISSFKSIMIIIPSFGEYYESAEKWGVDIVCVSLNEDMEYDYEAIAKNLDSVEAIIIGNPNNPNGGIIDKEKFLPIIERCEKEGKKIIIDEAFVEFTGRYKESFIYQLKDYKSLFIIRAITKFYAMPGIRFGYGICADGDFIDKLKEKQNPWNINAFAELAVKYVLKDRNYIDESIEWIKVEREYLKGELKKLDIIEKVFDTHGNYILCKLKNIDCDRLYEYSLERGIVIRKCNNYIGLNKSYVRFAIKDRLNNDKLLQVLKKIIYNL
ncbi:histidinol-phosphate transaminase [uncultured Clostridium sp.]|uniref:pyridoxal phosphate-dependent aminotransferase n=1 Tax=uncultured Clostridium sp. TaxID=59620 RepID=UPI0028F13A49|nr:histidinol-phosphate transaminase [uncultured Clostridium sp.]